MGKLGKNRERKGGKEGGREQEGEGRREDENSVGQRSRFKEMYNGGKRGKKERVEMEGVGTRYNGHCSPSIPQSGWDQSSKFIKIYITGISDLSQISKESVHSVFKAK